MACWLCWSLCGPALHGQETTREQPKQSEAKSVNAAAEEEVRKLRTELDARATQLQKLQSRLAMTEVSREMLSAQLQKVRETLEAVAKEKESAEEQARRQADKMLAEMRELRARQLATDVLGGPPSNPLERGDESASSKTPFLDPLQLDATRQSLEAAARAKAADALKKTADTLSQVARQAEGAASKLDEGKPGLSRGAKPDLGEGWKNLLERADAILIQTRRSEEAAASFLPKLEAAVTQLRKAGRNEEAEQLEAEASRLLGHERRAAKRRQDELRPHQAPGDDRRQGGWGDVEQAVDQLRREVNELRGEVRDLRRSLERGPKADESSRHSSHTQDGPRELVSVRTRFPGEVLRFGEGARPLRVGDRVKKGDALAVLWSKELADQTDKLAKYQKHLEAACKELEAAGPDVVPAQRLVEVKRALDVGQAAVRQLKRDVLVWPVAEEALLERLRKIDEGAFDGRPEATGEWPLAAPADGTIVERNLSIGEVVNPGDVLFQIEIDRPSMTEAPEVH
ncbi:MAG TPA: efflux RND transporter periplasmic adaptor subunit [Pirellulales bacterium]|jgi:biotin carboxyl carrier protein|nr:efflux RND transporter periplasmic adaptor subunit [Pirellulales bacterium]